MKKKGGGVSDKWEVREEVVWYDMFDPLPS